MKIARLSFGVDEGDDSDFDEEADEKFKMSKNPDVDTSFLPDKNREAEENKLREKLRQVKRDKPDIT